MCILMTIGCTNASRAQLNGYGSDFVITQYGCDGTMINQWISTGKVLTEEHSDGYYFMDSESRKLIRITGTLVIEQK